MTKKLLSILFLIGSISVGTAQTKDDLKNEISSKTDSISAIQGRVDDLQKQLDEFPGWKFGVFG